MIPPAVVEDDFIVTLSDGDDNYDSSEESAAELSRAPLQPTSSGPNGKKRKLGQLQATNGVDDKGVKSKKLKKSEKLDKQIEEDEERTWIDKGEDDGAIDPDFEFDVGGADSGVVEDFDAWGLVNERENEAQTSATKKTVDLDDIIARRRAAMEPVVDDDPADVAAEETEKGAYDNDELLAEDGFGMGAPLGVKDEDEDAEEDGSKSTDEDETAHEGEEDDSASDDDSVATPVPHPDDEVSDESQDEDDEDDDAEERARREAFFAPEDNQTKPSAKSFQSMSLSRPILKGLAAVGFTAPTPIQQKTIPIALMGKDVVGGAVTGSGKTAAFVIPILERLLYRPRKVPTSRVAILMPTRELAVQCFNVARKLASFTDITFCQLVGGFSLREQENTLKTRPDVIIATPGRFIDHMRNSPSFTVDTLEILVLDEADRMLEDGFADELNEILTTIPKSRQTMLFSATMTDSVDKLIRVGLNRPVRLLVDAKKATAGTLVQEFVRLRPGREDKRLGYLLYLCKNVYTDRVIIFFRQKKEAHRVRIVFGLCNLQAAELHGGMSQEQRISAVDSFRSHKVPYLLATDVASRGLDIKGVETVINYEAPQTHEIYLHRVGRTARAGRQGRACTIAAESDRKVVKQAVKAARSQQNESNSPDGTRSSSKIVSRKIDPAVADKWAAKAAELQDEVKAVLDDEKQEKQLASAERQVRRTENMLEHREEILARPKRTWFESEKEKLIARKRGLDELNGPAAGSKPKLSSKDKKRLDDKRERAEGRTWKKGKKERMGKGAAAPTRHKRKRT